MSRCTHCGDKYYGGCRHCAYRFYEHNVTSVDMLWPDTLAANLREAGALCEAFNLGYFAADDYHARLEYPESYPDNDDLNSLFDQWYPGCRRPSRP